MDGLIIAAALGAGTVAGVWFAFSGFVMAALDQLPAAHAAARCRRSTARPCARR